MADSGPAQACHSSELIAFFSPALQTHARLLLQNMLSWEGDVVVQQYRNSLQLVATNRCNQLGMHATAMAMGHG
jgi:hypothetical protein